MRRGHNIFLVVLLLQITASTVSAQTPSAQHLDTGGEHRIRQWIANRVRVCSEKSWGGPIPWRYITADSIESVVGGGCIITTTHSEHVYGAEPRIWSKDISYYDHLGKTLKSIDLLRGDTTIYEYDSKGRQVSQRGTVYRDPMQVTYTYDGERLVSELRSYTIRGEYLETQKRLEYFEDSIVITTVQRSPSGNRSSRDVKHLDSLGRVTRETRDDGDDDVSYYWSTNIGPDWTRDNIDDKITKYYYKNGQHVATRDEEYLYIMRYEPNGLLRGLRMIKDPGPLNISGLSSEELFARFPIAKSEVEYDYTYW